MLLFEEWCTYMQYKKYYGVFCYVENVLYGITYDDKLFRRLIAYDNYVCAHNSLRDAKYMLDCVKRNKYFANDFKSNLFILKLSGRYLTPIFKRYNKLYKLNWSQYTFFNKVYKKDKKKTPFFYVKSINFNQI